MAQHTRKVEINLGYRCNAKCPFCYYYDSVVTRENEETLSTEQARAQLRQAQRLGIREIEFTGGEVTMRRDLAELIAYARSELGFSVVSMITNGIRAAQKPYLAGLRQAGLDDVLFSIHGHDAATHDDVTKVPRSFERIVQAIDHARELGMRVRTNTVVCKTNYQHLTAIVELLLRHRVHNINLVMFNPILQAKNVDITEAVYVRYEDAAPEIIRAIETWEHVLPLFNVRYLPFCYLPGYERYVTNMDQMTFDPDEWDNFASFRIRKGALVSWGTALAGALRLPYLRQVLKHGIAATLTAGQSRFYTLKDRVKTRACHRCAYENVCDYVYRDYLEHYRDTTLTPVEGAKVAHPAWIMDAARARQPGSLPSLARDVQTSAVTATAQRIALRQL